MRALYSSLRASILSTRGVIFLTSREEEVPKMACKNPTVMLPFQSESLPSVRVGDRQLPVLYHSFSPVESGRWNYLSPIDPSNSVYPARLFRMEAEYDIIGVKERSRAAETEER